jgi:predicted peptidase
LSGTQTSASTQAVTPGNWITQSINGMQYNVLLPANYDPSVKYPTLLYLHQLDMGNDPSGLLAEVNPWFNSTAFRASTPAIVVMPILDQHADPSGQTINFGGISSNDNPGETNAIAALKQVMSQYSADSSRIYVTGNSMGGIGTEDMLIKYNAYTGTEGKLFAAGLALAGADYGQGYPQPNASVVSGLKNVPFWAIHGGQDTTVPLTWDQNLYAAEQAAGGDMKFTQDNSLGHDVWDTYYPKTGADSPLGWLFSQSTGGTTVTPPPPNVTPSANNTVVTGTSGSITDASGNKWTITSGGQVAVNGVTDTQTANVRQLAYVNGTIWQENSSNLWWGETRNNDAWAPSAGTATSPLPGATPPSPPPTVTRDPTQIPFASDSYFNLPLGLGAQWTSNAQLASAGIYFNAAGNYNEPIYASTANDPLVTVYDSNTQQGMAPVTYKLHIPANAAQAVGGDAILNVDDTTTHTWYSFGTFNWTGGNTATADGGSAEPDYGSGIAYNNGNNDEGVGTLRASDLKAGAINHMLRMELPTDMLASYSRDPGGPLAPNAWPRTTQDYNGPTAYTGTINFGVTIGIPAGAAEPTDVAANAGADMLWKALQHHGAQVRDSGGSGNTVIFQTDQDIDGGNPLIQGMQQYGHEIMAATKILANQGPNSVNGGGTPIVPLDPPLSDAPTVTPPPPNVTPSANNTVVTGISGSITDASGNKWTITGGGQVAVNGVPDAQTANVKQLAYVNGTIWQENNSNLWWGETQNNDAWAPSAGTATSPLPAPVVPSANLTVVTDTSGSITDASGNKWTITTGAKVAINGVTDTQTANVKELAYVNGTIWHENASNLWWGETQNNDSWAPSAGTAISPLPVMDPLPPPPNAIGSGSDTIVLTMSEDADGPMGATGRDAEFTLNVDGQQIGGVQTVTASHAAGKTQTFTFQTNDAPGKHAIAITFVNNSMAGGDKAAFNDGGDRNLYVNSVAYDATPVSTTVTGIYQSPFYPPLNTNGVEPGNAVFMVNDTTTVPANAPSTPSTTPAAVSVGTGADALTLMMSEDPYQGDAQFTVSVDGKQVGGTLTTTAIEYEGQAQAFVLHGAWGNAPHTVSVAYLNDMVGPPDARGTYDSVDRNLLINSVSYDGTTVAGTPYELFNNGSHSFSVPATNPPNSLPPTTSPRSPDNTMLLAGSRDAITDASGNKWTINGNAQVAVNGTADTTTGHVTELAYVGGKVWQENTGNLWWGKVAPTDAWSPGAGTSTSPLPAPVMLAAGTSTVSQSQISLVATSGSHMLFLSGSGDIVNLGGGANTITDTGKGNTYILPAAGTGTDTFTGNILKNGDTLDLKPALAATNWNGWSTTIAKYLSVVDTAQGGTILVSATAGGPGVAVATINGATTLNLGSLLAHAIV